MLTRDKIEEKYLEILRKKFHVLPAEKYPDIMINLFIDEGMEKILGKSFCKKKIGQKKIPKIYKFVLNKIKFHYGKYANLTNFRIKGNGSSIRFNTNFHLIFKVRDGDQKLGYLYGNDTRSISQGILFTEHCIERFEERLLPVMFYRLNEDMTQLLHCEPTTLDLMTGLFLQMPPHQYGQANNIYYLNIYFGILVLEKMEEIYIAKTFLSPDLLKSQITWYDLKGQPVIQSELPQHESLTNPGHFDSISEFMSSEFEEVKEPTFINPTHFKSFLKDLGKLNQKAIKVLEDLKKKHPENSEVLQKDINDLDNNFRKFKKFMSHPGTEEERQELQRESNELKERFKDTPILYYMNEIDHI